MLTLDEITEKMLKLETELDTLKNCNFSKLFILNIKKKERELKKLTTMRGKLLSPDNFLDKFAVDKIKICVSQDFDNKNYNQLLRTCSKMRASMVDNWGFLVPTVRIIDNAKLNKNEFEVVLTNRESQIFQIPENISQAEACNYIISKLQTYLFDRAEAFLSISDMFLYVRAAQKNEPDFFKSQSFWDSYSNWFAYYFGYILIPLLSERYCIKNINYIVDFIYTKVLYEQKNKDYVLFELKKNLKKYPEELFVSDWAINSSFQAV